MKSNSESPSDNRLFGSISASVAPFKNLLPKSKQRMGLKKPKSNSENIAPVDPNILIKDPPLSASTSFPKKSALKSQVEPQKEEITTPVVEENVHSASDQPVKVVARIKPVNGSGLGEVRNVSKDSVSVGEKKYTFDSVFDSNSTQEDIYKNIGEPLVRDALAGYNTSVLAYGQTGSGKTYTMWGPPSAMVGGPSDIGPQGVAPRIFQKLFSEIQNEQENADGKLINYQCRCSFLEVYNEKIGDLLDPMQRNLEIKDNAKNGFYVENLTEEYVTSYEDVTQILIKGLSSRKVGATNKNSKSSRSHIVFTCIIESWCKESSEKCFVSSKTSRISLVDIAGFERNMHDDAGREHVKEVKCIKKSLSRLGHLVNILAESSHSGRTEEVPYRSSCLTHLLRESLGGNAKLSVICAISPDDRSVAETISTLRFGQRAKRMKNKPVINEITEEDVNDLSDQIRRLKEELIRAKSGSSYNSFSNTHGYFKGPSMRQSLNKLRLSLNHSLVLPSIEKDSEEVNINEDDVKDLKLQIEKLCDSHEESSEYGDRTQLYSAECCETDLTCEQYLSCSEQSESEEIDSGETRTELQNPKSTASASESKITMDLISIDPPSRSNLSISRSPQSAVLPDPMLSESPKIRKSPRKSVVFSSNHLPKEDMLGTSKDLDMLHEPKNNIKSSLRSSRIFPGPTESLAANLQRGLQIIDEHQRNSASTRSSVSFSFGHLALKPRPSMDKANASIQTSQEEEQSLDGVASFMCVKCKARGRDVSEETKQDVEKDLDMAIEREKELDSMCKNQAARIEQLNQLLEKYEAEQDQQAPPDNDSKLLTWSGHESSHLEFIKEKCEIKEVQEELKPNPEESFDVEERKELLREIETLKAKLKSYADAPMNKSTDKLRSSLLARSIQLRSSQFARGNSGEELEQERQRWMEMESDWISLTDELRIEIESNRQRAEKVEMELLLEKKYTEELDDVVHRSVLGHARMVEHYAELQEKYNDLVEKHRAIMEGIAEVKRAAAKAGSKGQGSRFSKSLAAELSALRVEKERERKLLKKENQSLKVQLKDTAEAVHAAGELLVRLREAEEKASVNEEKSVAMQEENDKLKKQIEKLKRKHKMEMITMKQYLAESKLPQAALQQPLLYRQDSDIVHHDTTTPPDDDQAWRAEFGAIYQEHY